MYVHDFVRNFEYSIFRIRNHFGRIGKDFDPDSVHELRVEIKRIRALFKIIEAINPKFDFKKNYKSARLLFKAAADLRDNQVQQELAESWETQFKINRSSYTHLLQEQETAIRAKLFQFLKKYRLKIIKQRSAIIRHTLAEIPEDIAQARANIWLQELAERLVAIQAEAGQIPEKLHSLRTQAKQTRYTLDYLSQCLPKVPFPKILSPRLKRLHHELGLWHDHQVALEMLDKFRRENDEKFIASQVDYERIERTIQRRQQRLLQSYEKAWESVRLSIGIQNSK